MDVQEPAFYNGDATAILIADYDGTELPARDALERANVRVLCRLSLIEAAVLSELPAADLIYLEAGVASLDDLEPVCAATATAIGDTGARAIASVGLEQIDLASAYLLGTGTYFLCESNPAERRYVIAAAIAPQSERVHDQVREGEQERLLRLSEDVARIGNVLTQIVQERAGDLPSCDAPSSERVSAPEVRAIIRSRRLRDQFFSSELFADPAWDMLLDLYAARLEGRQVSVSSLCVAASVPPTTALRWITLMQARGLFIRHADPSDRRRSNLTLSPKAFEMMTGYLGATRRAGFPLI